MKFRTTAILLVVCAAAVLFFVKVEQPQHARREKASKALRFTDVPAESVFAVRIERPDVTISASLENGAWTLTSPVAERADDASVNVLLQSISAATVERRLAGVGSGPGEYGLDPPAAIVRLSGRNGDLLLELRVGEFNVTKDECYAAKGENAGVMLIGADVHRYAIRPLFDFRNKRIIDVALDLVRRLDISTPVRSMSWRTRADGSWFTVQHGDTIDGDKPALENIVRRLRGLRADEFPPGASGTDDTHLSPRSGSISMWLERDSSRVETTFGGRHDDRCYVWSSQTGRIARVDTTALEVFAWAIDDVRDKRLLRFDRSGLTRISVERPGRAIAIIKSDDGWAFSNPAFGILESQTVNRFLAALEDLRFDAVLDEKTPAMDRHGFDNPFLRVTLFGRSGDVVDALAVGATISNETSRYATSRSARLLASVTPPRLAGVEDLFVDRAGR